MYRENDLNDFPCLYIMTAFALGVLIFLQPVLRSFLGARACEVSGLMLMLYYSKQELSLNH